MSLIEIGAKDSLLTLRELTSQDAAVYYALVDANRDHLTRHGDYQDLKVATLESVTADLDSVVAGHLCFGAWYRGELVGRFDLIRRAPGNFVLGYWLGKDSTGRGFATVAGDALIQYGRKHLGATDIWAGVTKGNDASVAVLHRLGLQAVEDMGEYTRFHRAVS